MPLFLLLLLLLLSSQIPLTPSLPTQHLHPHPHPHPHPLLPTTLPTFPAQSAAATPGGAACPLHLSGDLLSIISSSCSARHHLPASRLRCCPSLAAALFSSYASSALSAASGNLPVLPDDSEACAGAAEREIARRGVELPRVNGTCGASYCYCGIRLRRLTCGAGGASVAGKWAPPGPWGPRLRKSCAREGVAGCSSCLRTLDQLKGTAGNRSFLNEKNGTPRVNDCQLMGLTWLLSENRTRYLPAATAVLRTFMAAAAAAAEDGTSAGEVGPTCHQISDEMPIAVGSSEIDGYDYADLSAAGELPQCLLSLVVHFLVSVVLYLCDFGV